MKTEAEIVEQLRREADAASRLFSNSGQALQERTAVAGLLRVLGVGFEEDEVIKSGPEPIDVHFHQARFQVTEVLDANRRRNTEIRQIAQRRRQARSLDDLVVRGVVSSGPASTGNVFAMVERACAKKHARYGAACRGVDLLAYVNLRGRHLYPIKPWPPSTALATMGWRSVSMVMEPYASVLYAGSGAPAFLAAREGDICRWQGLDSCFPILTDESTFR